MNIDNYTSLFITSLLVAITIGSTYMYWKSSIHKNHKFVIYLRILMAVSVLITAYAIYLQISYYQYDSHNSEITFFTNLMKNFLDDNIKIFIKYPHMNYYYAELMGFRYNQRYKRDYMVENQISNIIFSRLASVAYYIETSSDYSSKEDLTELQSRFDAVIGTFLKSKIFRDNWKIYKEKLSGPPIRRYMENNFGI